MKTNTFSKIMPDWLSKQLQAEWQSYIKALILSIARQPETVPDHTGKSRRERKRTAIKKVS